MTFRIGVVAALVAFAGGCSCGGVAPSGPDLPQASLAIDRTEGVIADGVDAATVTVTATHADGSPFAGVEIDWSVSGEGNTLTAAAPTNEQGVSTLTLTSTRAESKTITVSVKSGDAFVPLESKPTVEFVSGPAAQLAFTVPPSTAQAGAVIAPPVQVSIQDAHGNAVAAATAEVTVALESDDGGAALEGTTSRTAAAGVATFDDLRIARAGTGYTLRATSVGLVDAVSAAFDITTGPPAKLVFVTEPSDATAGEPLTPAVELAVEDAEGNRLVDSEVLVTVALGNNPTGGGLDGTLSAAPQAGVVRFADLSIAEAGEGYTLAATAPGLAGAQSAPFTIGPAAPSQASSSLIVTPSMVLADGTSTTVLEVSVADALGNPVPGQTVSFGATGVQNVFVPAGATAITDGSGLASISLQSTRAETKAITADVAGLFELQGGVTFLPGAPDQTSSTLVATTSLAVADGMDAIGFTVTLIDAFGNPVPGEAVTFTATGTQNTFSSAAGSTDASGVFTTTLTSTRAESKTVTATIAGFALTAQVAFEPGAPSTANSAFAANPASVVADGVATSQLTLVVRDATGNAVPNVPVALASSGTSNTFTPGSGSTDSTGTFTATMSSTRAEAKSVTATAGPATLGTTVTFTPGAPAQATTTLTATPASFIANGADATQLTLSVQDAFGNAVPNTAVSLTASGTANTLTPGSGTTDGSGQLTATLTSTTAEAKTITASVAGFTVAANATAVAGPADPMQSTLTANPLVAPANGSAQIQLTATVRDAFGNVVTGEPVTFTSSEAGDVFTPASGSTDPAGVVTSAVTGTAAGPRTVNAVFSTGLVNVTISFTPWVLRTFTTCGANGPTGPTQSQCDTAYAGGALDTEVTVSSGIQLWTVPFSGTYRIQAAGAQGGAGGTGTAGGLGASIGGEFVLTAGDQLKILVGQQGGTYPAGGGGGGGSFVVRQDDTPLLIAGGGGGGNGPYSSRGAFNGGPGLTGISGGDSNQTAGNYGAAAPGPGGGAIAHGGTDGWGGGGAVSAGGGGFFGPGGASSYAVEPGAGFLAGGAGGQGVDPGGASNLNAGGFGGGGGGHYSSGYGGGAGGYSGGGAGNWNGTTHGNGGGGGSFNAGTNPTQTSGVRAGDGQVTIELL